MMLRQRQPRGTSLIEAVAMMVIVGLLLTMSGTLLARAGRIHVTAVKAVAEMETLRTLVARLRNDAARASTAHIDESGPLTFEFDGHRVRYSLHNERNVLRETLNADKVIGRDRWQLNAAFALKATLERSGAEQADGPSLLRVVLAHAATPEASGRAPIEVVMRVGSSRWTARSTARETES